MLVQLLHKRIIPVGYSYYNSTLPGRFSVWFQVFFGAPLLIVDMFTLADFGRYLNPADWPTFEPIRIGPYFYLPGWSIFSPC